MNWIVYGSYGYIGNRVCEYIIKNHPEVTLIRPKTRVEDIEAVKLDLDNYKPDELLCFVGRTSGGNIKTIDYLADKLHENLKDNLYAPLILMKLSQERGIHMTYMGTGCIFHYNNEDDEPFTEDSNPNFFGSSYSTVKGFTDLISRFLFSNVLNVRIRMPIFGEKHQKDFIYKIVNYTKINNRLNTVTIFDDLIPDLISDIINKRVGTVNMVHDGPIYHVQILDLYMKYIDPTHQYELASDEEMKKLLKEGRSNNVLKSSYPRSESAITLIEKLILNYK